MNSVPSARVGLRRAISRRMLLVLIIGDVLGAGIYALIGEVAGEVGGAIWVPFCLALLLALLTAASYAELVTKYPRAGGAALFSKHAFGSPFIAFMVAFCVMASGVTSASTLARAFGGDYLGEFVNLPTVLAAIFFLLAVAVINFAGISHSVRVNLALTTVELLGLLLISVIGLAAASSGVGDPGRAFELAEGRDLVPAVLAGTALAFYALIGFEDSVNLAEETIEPSRAYPLALFGGLAIAGAIYLLVTVTASMAVPTDRLTDSSGPLLEVAKVGPLSIPTRVFSAISLLAIANGALINMIMASRLLYGMADEGVMPPGFARVHPDRRTPWVAICFTTALALVLASTGDLATLADTTVLLLLGVFLVVNMSVLLLRRRPVPHPHFTTPVALPVLGAIGCLLLFTQTDPEVIARAAALLILGALLWVLDRGWLGRRGGGARD